VRHPLAVVPPRRAGVLRRTMHVDIGVRTELSGALVLSGAARDVVTSSTQADQRDPEGPPPATVLAESEVEARFGEDRCLVELQTSPNVRWAPELVGARAGGGFRRVLDVVLPPDERSSLLGQLLDDLPAGALISGYAWMRVARRAGRRPVELMPVQALDRMTDLCSGWRQGGICEQSVRGGHGVPVQDTPPAPDLRGDDPLAWHAIAPLPPDWMRRRRLIDVEVSDDDRFAVWAMFRDSVGEPDGGEVVLHEYAVHVEGERRGITSVVAEPRVLPFPECRPAAEAVGALRGRDIDTLGAVVPDVLIGVASCTHLNDLLRSLGGVGGLLDHARDRGSGTQPGGRTSVAPR
jgi:hypothetical protein